MKYKLSLYSNNGDISYVDSQIILNCQSSRKDTHFSMSVDLTEWENDAYIFVRSNQRRKVS